MASRNSLHHICQQRTTMTKRKEDSSSPGYSVGYGKPPVATRFQPGRSGNPTGGSKGGKETEATIVRVLNETVVVADFLFTATAIVLQPVTGVALAVLIGWPLREGWILLSLALYAVAGMFWLPVVFMQIRMRDLARDAARAGSPLPQAYQKLFRLWFAAGLPAFAAVLGILWLMLAKRVF